MTNLAWGALAVVVAGLVGGAWGEHRGHARGVLETQAAHDANTVSVLRDQVTQSTTAITTSNQASADMRQAVGRLEQINRQSTSDLKHALELSKPDRVVCSFDADSMRILGAAADVADGRAAAGIRGALPAGSPADR